MLPMLLVVGRPGARLPAPADDVVAPAELDRIKSRCKELGLPDGETQKVVVTAGSRNGGAAQRGSSSCS